jgi:hypothetical protein
LHRTKSRFPAFAEVLARFLMEGKGTALAAALAKRLLRLVAQARVNAGMEISSLRTPQEELRRKVTVSERKRAEVEQERRDFGVLLEAEVKRLADQTVTLDATLAGIETALKKGVEASAADSAHAERCAAQLGAELERLAGLAERLRILAALEHSA